MLSRRGRFIFRCTDRPAERAVIPVSTRRDGRMPYRGKEGEHVMDGIRTSNPGAIHANLEGGGASFRFRPERLTTDSLGFDVTCCFSNENTKFGPFKVVDLSSTGLGVEGETDETLAPGSHLLDFIIQYRESTVWSGTAVVVYQIDNPNGRLGIRFTSGLFDPEHLKLSDALVEQLLDQELHRRERQIDLLPATWRAGVAEMRRVLSVVKLVLDTMEKRSRRGDWWRQMQDIQGFIELVYQKWANSFVEQACHLEAQSLDLDPEVVSLARDYASNELIPLLYPCPMHSRAYDKPLGYAGDYRLMTLYFSEELEGESLYSRFLHFVSKNYTLGRTVLNRERTMRELLEESILADRPLRIVSLASGPGIEILNLIKGLDSLEHPVEFILIDQDEEALEYCHETLSRELISHKGDRLPITLSCLHFSVKQLLKPRDKDEEFVVNTLLKDVDLIYSAGLLDYLPQRIAQLLLNRLYASIRTGGRLFIGNLKRVPDTSWVMEYVLSWHLEYRTEESMKELGETLKPGAASVDIKLDQTEKCIFLDVVK